MRDEEMNREATELKGLGDSQFDKGEIENAVMSCKLPAL